jgi:soluble lytic murein transglycosylase-like protein
MLALCGALASAPSMAQVMEVRSDGSTATYAGPVVTLRDGIHPLTTTSGAGHPVLAAIRGAALRHQLSPALIAAVAWQESHWRQDAASPRGALGVMQLMPATAQGLGVDRTTLSGNIDGGAA